jgi:hypothetical protein
VRHLNPDIAGYRGTRSQDKLIGRLVDHPALKDIAVSRANNRIGVLAADHLRWKKEYTRDRIRTCDLRFRKPALYPTELRGLRSCRQ